MTNRDLIAIIAREIAPNPHKREDQGEISDSDFWEIKCARNKALRILDMLREAVVVR